MKIPSFNHAGIFAMTASVLVLGLNGCADNVGSSEHSHQQVQSRTNRALWHC
jgi:hypothetical protein